MKMCNLGSVLIIAFLIAPFISLALWFWKLIELWNHPLTWTMGTIFGLLGMIIWLIVSIAWAILAISLILVVEI